MARRLGRWILLVWIVIVGVSVSGCGGSSSGTEIPPKTH